jgi:hypothetical protein
MPDEQGRDERDASDIDVAVFAAESEPFRKMRTDFVAVKHLNTASASTKLGCETLGDRTFARTGETGKPHGESLVQVEFLSERQNLRGALHSRESEASNEGLPAGDFLRLPDCSSPAQAPV